jgi:hypothetical protein
MFASFAFEAVKTNGSFIRFKLKLHFGWLVIGRVLLGL